MKILFFLLSLFLFSCSSNTREISNRNNQEQVQTKNIGKSRTLYDFNYIGNTNDNLCEFLRRQGFYLYELDKSSKYFVQNAIKLTPSDSIYVMASIFPETGKVRALNLVFNNRSIETVSTGFENVYGNKEKTEINTGLFYSTNGKNGNYIRTMIKKDYKNMSTLVVILSREDALEWDKTMKGVKDLYELTK